MPLRVIASEPGFQPLRDSEIDPVPVEADVRRIRYVRNLGAGVTVVYEKVKSFRRIFFWGGFGVGCAAAIFFIIWLARSGETGSKIVCGDYINRSHPNYQDIRHYSKQTHNLIAVNLGGWLCIEDWLFSGSVGRFVNTPDELKSGQGACLPPHVTGPLPHPWSSEGNLVRVLLDDPVFGHSATIEALTAHRNSYITSKDFEKISKLGIKTVRIPMSWVAFADALAELGPEYREAYGHYDPENDTAIVPDPYYTEDCLFVTVPRFWLATQIAAAQKHGLRVILSLHNMPGGAQNRTYSGVWPLTPAFWTKRSRLGINSSKSIYNSSNAPLLVDMGLLIIKKLIKWMEGLPELLKAGAFRGVSLLNDPGHGLVVREKNQGWANSSMILNYVERYVSLYRRSLLIGHKVRLYIQLAETAFEHFEKDASEWWTTKLTKAERESWAVFGRHYYTAWGPIGQITPGADYQCDDSLPEINETLRRAVGSYAYKFGSLFEGNKAITEFSLGTHWDQDLGCTNGFVLRLLLNRTIEAFTLLEESDEYHWRGDDPMEPFFWTWRIPYAPKFQAAWSLKYFSGLGSEEQLNGVCKVGKWASLDPRKNPKTDRKDL